MFTYQNIYYHTLYSYECVFLIVLVIWLPLTIIYEWKDKNMNASLMCRSILNGTAKWNISMPKSQKTSVIINKQTSVLKYFYLKYYFCNCQTGKKHQTTCRSFNRKPFPKRLGNGYPPHLLSKSLLYEEVKKGPHLNP